MDSFVCFFFHPIYIISAHIFFILFYFFKFLFLQYCFKIWLFKIWHFHLITEDFPLISISQENFKAYMMCVCVYIYIHNIIKTCISICFHVYIYIYIYIMLCVCIYVYEIGYCEKSTAYKRGNNSCFLCQEEKIMHPKTSWKQTAEQKWIDIKVETYQ